MKFIVLNHAEGKLHINPEHIVMFYGSRVPGSKQKMATHVFLSNGKSYSVKETPEEIVLFVDNLS